MQNRQLLHKKNAELFLASRKRGERLQSLDCIRGLAVCLMVGHHFFFDLVEFVGAPPALFSNPVFDVLHIVFSSCFLLLSGISCRLSHSNLKRGVLTMIAALAVTVVTYNMDKMFNMRTLIAFGVLHLLACGMLLFAGTHKLLDKIPRAVTPLLYLALIWVTWKFFYMKVVSVSWLFPLGLMGINFYWTDYYPIFPWIFVFLMGTWLGIFLIEGRFPSKVYTFRFPPLAWIGRHALIVYLAHQPVLFGLTELIILLLGRS